MIVPKIKEEKTKTVPKLKYFRKYFSLLEHSLKERKHPSKLNKYNMTDIKNKIYSKIYIIKLLIIFIPFLLLVANFNFSFSHILIFSLFSLFFFFYIFF